jgi:Recombination endonuclease VII
MRTCRNGHEVLGNKCNICKKANYHKNKALKFPDGKTHCKRGHEFTPENTRLDGRGSRCCRACANMHSCNNSKIKLYGMTPEKREEMFNAQGRCCAVCKSTEHGGRGWQIDHDHATDEVRGILCQHCNLALGQAKDSIEILQALIEYLRRTSHGIVNYHDISDYGVGEEAQFQSSVCNRE